MEWQKIQPINTVKVSISELEQHGDGVIEVNASLLRILDNLFYRSSAESAKFTLANHFHHFASDHFKPLGELIPLNDMIDVDRKSTNETRLNYGQWNIQMMADGLQALTFSLDKLHVSGQQAHCMMCSSVSSSRRLLL